MSNREVGKLRSRHVNLRAPRPTGHPEAVLAAGDQLHHNRPRDISAQLLTLNVTQVGKVEDLDLRAAGTGVRSEGRIVAKRR